MDIWTRLDKLQTKINNELRNTGSPFYVRIDNYNFDTRAFDYKLSRRDSTSSQGKAKASEIVIKNLAIWIQKGPPSGFSL
jgi:hypothetical protein